MSRVRPVSRDLNNAEGPGQNRGRRHRHRTLPTPANSTGLNQTRWPTTHVVKVI
jgi:hypothetical protein